MVTRIICFCALFCIVSGYPKIAELKAKNVVMCQDQEDCLSHCLINGKQSGVCNDDRICICTPTIGSSWCGKWCDKSCIDVGYSTGICNAENDCTCHHVEINVV
eukprot:07334.XXX_463461_463094_1 [CDS] Oithona nana genome sequencing.